MVQDADMEVVRQMVRYMYTAKVINNNNQVTDFKKQVDHDFSRIKELLVLANKYQVELETYTSTFKISSYCTIKKVYLYITSSANLVRFSIFVYFEK